MRELAAALIALGTAWIIQAHVPPITSAKLARWIKERPLILDVAAAAAVIGGIVLVSLGSLLGTTHPRIRVLGRPHRQPVTIVRPRPRLGPVEPAPALKPILVARVDLRSNVDSYLFVKGRLWTANYLGQSIDQLSVAQLRPLKHIGLNYQPWGLSYAGGSIWTTSGGWIERFTPTGHFITSIRVPGGPTAVVQGGGSLWTATSTNAGLLWKIDPRRNRVIARIALAGPPWEIGYAYGLVWVLINYSSDSGGQLVEVEPHSGAVVAILNVPTYSLVDFAGNLVWAETANQLTAIDPNTGAPVAQFAFPRMMGTVVADGAVWAINYVRGSARICQLNEVDPKRLLVTARFLLPSTCDGAIAAPDGYLWISDEVPGDPRQVFKLALR